MTESCNITMTGEDFKRLMAHLYPGDGDEHGAILTAGIMSAGSSLRLLVRSVEIARAGTDYVAGTTGYRALHPTFIHRHITRCREERLAYLAVHNHDSDTSVAFSHIDMASHDRGYPALRDIGRGIPVGALVFGRRSAQADIWMPDGRRLTLNELRVIGRGVRRLYPSPRLDGHVSAEHDRQILMLGQQGQKMLRDARVAVIGLGGIGSIVAEHLGRLGVGDILLIDPDRIEDSNLSRVVGARSADLSRALYKIEIAERHLRELDDDKVVRTLAEDVSKRSVSAQLRDCDFLFLAADSMRARLVFNALVHQYLIPGLQLGAKVRTTRTGEIEDAMSAIRDVRPGHGCLWCNQLIDPTGLAIEAKSDQERKDQAYGVGVPNPSVITLNAVSAAHAVNEFLFYILGLREDEQPATYRHLHSLGGFAAKVMPRRDADCHECGFSGRLGRGDVMSLPASDG